MFFVLLDYVFLISSSKHFTANDNSLFSTKKGVIIFTFSLVNIMKRQQDYSETGGQGVGKTQ